jgi:predicted permease
MRTFLRKLIWFTQRRRRESELQEELRFHIEEEAEQLRERGLADDAAQRAALREIGNVALIQEDARAAWTWTWLEQLLQDLRYGLRAMRKSPAFTSLAVLSLALGIGANTAIYSFMDSILLRPLPVSDPDSLAMLTWRTREPEVHGWDHHDSTYKDPETGFHGGEFSYPAFELFQGKSSIFASVFGYQGTGTVNLMIHGQAELASGEFVSGEYFRGLGISPAAGRLVEPNDDRADAPPVAAVSSAFSQRHFGEPGHAVGHVIMLNNNPFTVIGVTPPEFFGTDPAAPADFYIPLHSTLLLMADVPYGPPARWYLDPDEEWVEVMGRLRPGVSRVQAQAALAGPFRQWETTSTHARNRSDLPALVVAEGRNGMNGLRREYSKPLYVLMILVGLILAIACANIANLLLARTAARRREIAVRLSIGAGRGRVIRQLLTESILLAALGGAAGIETAILGIRFLTLLLANGRENFTLRADLNWHVLGVAAALSLLTGILFGLAPALQSTRVDLIGALKASSADERRARLLGRISLRHVLVVAQIAFGFLIMVAAGLFARTLANLGSVELGFNPDHLLTFELDARSAGLRDPEIGPFCATLLNRLSAIPGVQSAGASDFSLVGGGNWYTSVLVSGAPRKSYRIRKVGPGFFRTMQIPILLGREVDERDKAGAPAIAIVNEAFAKANFGNQNPLGRHLVFPSGACPRCQVEIAGVCGNARYKGLKGDIPPVIYLPFLQGITEPVRQLVYELRTTGNPLLYVNAVRTIVRQADARLPVAEVRTQRELIDQTINQEITFTRLCGAFALLALVIVCIGLYGTMSYLVSRRTGEIGIRMALGARGGVLAWMVVREVLVLAGIGLAIGVPTALGASEFVESFLFGIKRNDPLALTAAAVILLGATLLAGYMPARAATRIDPMVALRQE